MSETFICDNSAELVSWAKLHRNYVELILGKQWSVRTINSYRGNFKILGECAPATIIINDEELILLFRIKFPAAYITVRNTSYNI